MKKVLQLLMLLFFNFLFAQESAYEILNTSINSKFAELGVTYSSNNSVIFASSKKDNSGRRTNNRQLSLELYHGLIVENGDIFQTNKFSSEINNKFFESDIAFTPDFKTIYFTWNNFYSALKSKDSAKWKTLYMFKASINEKFQISEVTPLPFNSKEYSVRSPRVSKDGKKLYFASDMSGGFGETDIYVVDINNEENYGTPKNLGPTVNTKFAELFPFIDENNTLYFSSNGHKGLGGMDIYKSEFNNGNFRQAKSLSPPINSKYDDFALVIDIVSNTGYFTSNRDGGKGDVDIYAFKVKEHECAQTMTIFALNELTEQSLDHVTVSLFQNNSLIEKQIISKGFGYKFNIECNKTYKIVAQKENYEIMELTLLTDGKYNSEITKTLKLTPIECVQIVSGTVADSKTNLPIDHVTVSLFQNNSLIEKQIISKGFGYKFNIECNKTYKIVAQKENFEITELTLLTDGKFNSEITKSLKLTPIECVQIVSGTVSDNKTNLPIDQVTVSLFQNSKLIEKQIIGKGFGFKFNIECNKTYKIVAQKENYEITELTLLTDGKFNSEITKTLKLTPIECVQIVSGTVADSK
ncbi:MAG: TolB family protein, partial [Lutibacter sp.]